MQDFLRPFAGIVALFDKTTAQRPGKKCGDGLSRISIMIFEGF